MANNGGPTKRVSWEALLGDKAIKYGFEDGMAGRPYRRGYDKWTERGTKGYERGRFIAAAAKGLGFNSMKLKKGAHLTNECVDTLNSMFETKGGWI